MTVSQKILEEFYKILSTFEHEDVKGEFSKKNVARLSKLEDDLTQYTNAFIKDEIEQNIVLLDKHDRKFYLNRIIKRLTNIIEIEREGLIDFQDFQETYDHFKKELVLKETAVSKSILYLNDILDEHELDESKRIGSKNEDFPKQIFKDREKFLWFESCLISLGAVDQESKSIKRGFQAKANAIFAYVGCKETVFNYEVPLNAYIDFLNIKYNGKIKNRDKLSAGTNHEKQVEDLFKIHFKQLLQMKPE